MMSQAARQAEKVIGHGDNATTAQNVTNPGNDESTADYSETMKALAWYGKNEVRMIDTPKPKILEDRDVIVKVTGSTVCGSDLHLLHGTVVEMQKGDILGHEFCGVVDECGPGVTKFKKGQRVVASFQIACGDCYYCKQKLSSQCEKTNSNTIENAMYGGRTAGMFGYSHFTGGYAGGQAEYTRVAYGDVNLLPLPDDVPDEAGLFLSDVLCTSWHAVVDTGVNKGDVVAIWGAGPIGQMAADFSLMQGASRVIMIDSNWRLDFVKARYPNVDTLDFSTLAKGESVTSKLQEMCNNRGPDVSIECAAGEYAKGWAHYFEMMLGLETDTSELINAKTQHFGPSSTFITLFLVLLLHIHYAKSDLRLNYYSESCPRAEEIIKEQVNKLYHKHGNTAVSWIRNLFHDCMVKSCDASILLDKTKEQTSEKTSQRNFGMRNFKYIETIKEALENECPNIVSCADIVALAARDGIVMLGGPQIEMKTGRWDSKDSYLAEVESFIPNHNDSMSLVLSRFNSVGVDTQGTVALLGAHTVGRVHCVNIVHRLYPTVDPTLDPDFAKYLKTRCPSAEPDPKAVEYARNDHVNPMVWDNLYYKNIMSNKGLLIVDQQLVSDPTTYPFVEKFAANNSYFNDQFAKSFIILSENNPLSGDQGEIRKVCRHVNK